ncbi:putative cytochrome p450 [Rosellinia necatrix]|uniref:Putative cytochrome p450 n=1 Tax=Rosellinia necatrix TaxID=77044 RepID=A0A1W2TG54_ROSNE|nr:putative cytochrome p450 [Rosellinia necatrix]
MNDSFQFHFDFPSLEGAWIPHALVSTYSIPYYLGIALATLITYAWATSNPSLKKLPHINYSGLFSDSRAQLEFRYSARTMLQKARKQYPNKPYRMTTEFGEVVMLQSESMDDIRNSPHLSFMGTVAQERICEIPGFEPLAALGESGDLVLLIARKQLTKLLAQVTSPLSEEIALGVSINMGESTEWREIMLMPAIRDVTARMSSRVFVGKELARNEDFLEIVKGYTVHTMAAMIKLSRYPVNIRPYIGWLFPECRRVRDYYSRTQKLIDPVVKKREEAKRAALAAGQQAPIYNDALEWIEQESMGRKTEYDPATFQLIVSTVAINTTTDLLQSVMVDLIQHPETMQAVRDEIVRILRADGWQKSSLYNMKLLDSVMKETQRMRPIFLAIRRSVEADMTLPDGTVLKKGMRLHIDTHRMGDPAVYESPEEWRPDRFLQLRSQPGKEHVAQLVSTSVDHLGFGHGEHACPGRFFAANEMKVALCHLLIKYDWELAPGTDTSVSVNGFMQRANPAIRVLCRRREVVELDIDSI